MPKKIRHWGGLVWKKCPVSIFHGPTYSVGFIMVMFGLVPRESLAFFTYKPLLQHVTSGG